MSTDPCLHCTSSIHKDMPGPADQAGVIHFCHYMHLDISQTNLKPFTQSFIAPSSRCISRYATAEKAGRLNSMNQRPDEGFMRRGCCLSARIAGIREGIRVC